MNIDNTTVTVNDYEIKPLPPLDTLTEEEKSHRVLPPITVTLDLTITTETSEMLQGYFKQMGLDEYHSATVWDLDRWVSAISDMKVIREFGESDKELRERLEEYCKSYQMNKE
ncbi:hypothetical protein VP424E501_P0292 [Vibrio phage 424E50-1]|nr:hypothetical protein VP501E541_P0273 [Vibrio phage 501E54-1]CAH9015210.1 hypothetical protein VP424E501_P0292 [Vibrio phage 424E50-1]